MMEFLCDVCREPLERNKTVILWDEVLNNTVTELQIIHRGNFGNGGCDDNRLRRSTGACSYENWAFGTALSFFGKKFLKPEDHERLRDIVLWAKRAEEDNASETAK